MKSVTVMAVAFVFGIAIVVGMAFRDHEIRRCEDRGGVAITDPWYSETWWVVKCLEGGRQ